MKVNVSLAALALVSSIACGSDIPGPNFPETDELDRIAATFVESQGNALGGPRLPLWTLVEPLPTQIGIGPALGDSHGEQLLRQLAAVEPRLEIDEQLTCVAHQLAEFLARHGAAPTRALVRYMVHRCGATTPNFRWMTATLTGAPQLDDARELVAQHRYAGGPVGMWAIKGRDRWFLASVVAESSIEIAPMAMDASAGRVVIEGEVDSRDWLVAHVNLGKAGFEMCEKTDTAPRHFRLVCPVNPGDAGTYVDISAAPPGRLLGQVEARLWVSPDGSLGASFEDPTGGAPPTPIRETLEFDFVSAVNDLRAAAGSGPLTVSRVQSQAVAKLRPHYRDAQAHGNGKRLDTIALGLLAGWMIPDPILSGSFSALEFETLGGREHLLEAALSQPGQRAALLDPSLSQIAIAIDPGKGNEILGGMFVTYALAKPGPRTADRDTLARRVIRARAARRIPALQPLPGAAQLLAQAGEDVAQRGTGAQVALSQVITQLQAAHPNLTVAGWLAFAQDVEKMELPDVLLDAGTSMAALHIELVQGRDRPWATLMILIAHA